MNQVYVRTIQLCVDCCITLAVTMSIMHRNALVVRSTMDTQLHVALHDAKDRHRWRDIISKKLIQRVIFTTLSNDEYDARRRIMHSQVCTKCEVQAVLFRTVTRALRAVSSTVTGPDVATENAPYFQTTTRCSHMSEPACANNVEEALSTDIPEWRRKCGCIRTSEKLKRILHKFPAPPPPTPLSSLVTGQPIPPEKEKKWSNMSNLNTCQKLRMPNYYMCPTEKFTNFGVIEEQKLRSTFWQIIADVVQLVQLSVTATALALYYIIYCYMQLVYYTLRSALYFHNADIPMKITIGVVTMTSLVVGMNLLLRMERVIGLRY